MPSAGKNPTAIFIAISALLAGLITGYLIGFREGKRYSATADVSFAPTIQQPLLSGGPQPVLKAEAAEIVEDLNCVCGCGMDLAPCTCDEIRGSREVKAFINALVEAGTTRSEVLRRAVAKYGEGVLKK
ncbi:MAG: hypothetical protein ACE5LV_06320 [Candidatus Aminicenantales bacterium]